MSNYDLLILILTITLLAILAHWIFKHFCDPLRFQRFKERSNALKSAQRQTGNT